MWFSMLKRKINNSIKYWHWIELSIISIISSSEWVCSFLPGCCSDTDHHHSVKATITEYRQRTHMPLDISGWISNENIPGLVQPSLEKQIKPSSPRIINSVSQAEKTGHYIISEHVWKISLLMPIDSQQGRASGDGAWPESCESKWKTW